MKFADIVADAVGDAQALADKKAAADSASADEINKDDLTVYHVMDAGSSTASVDAIEPEIEGNDISVKVDHFSIFLLGAGFGEVEPVGATNNAALTGTLTWTADGWEDFQGRYGTANSTLLDITLTVDGKKLDNSSLNWTGTTTSTWTYRIGSVAYTDSSSISMNLSINSAKSSIVYNFTKTGNTPELNNGTITMPAITAALQKTSLTVSQNIIPSNTDKEEKYTVYVAPTKAQLTDDSIRRKYSITIKSDAESKIDDLPVGAWYQIVPAKDDDYTDTLTSAAGTDCAQLTANAANATYSWLQQSKYSPALVWMDNNDFAGLRPTDAAKITADLYVTTNGGVSYTKADDSNYGLYGLSSDRTYTVTKSGSYWYYTFNQKMPSVFNGNSQKYAVKFNTSDTSITDQYIMPAGIVTDSANAVLKQSLDFQIAWKDAAVSANIRPDSVSLNVYAVSSNSSGPVLLSLSSGDMTITKNTASGIWSVSVNNLPAYDENGAITYYATEDQPVSKSSSTAQYSAPKYQNSSGNNGDKTDACYQDGTITNMIDATTSFTAYKQWLTSGNKVPDESKITGTVYLWRYTAVGSNDEFNGSQATKTQDADSEVISCSLNGFTQMTAASGNYIDDSEYNYTYEHTFTDLPKYDSNGNQYVYFAKEVLEGTDQLKYDYHCENTDTDETGTGSSTKDFMYDRWVCFNHGKILNVPAQYIDLTVSKTWYSPSKQDELTNTSVKMNVYCRLKGTNHDWSLLRFADDADTLKGFSASAMTKKFTGYVPRYDSSGGEYEYAVLSETISDNKIEAIKVQNNQKYNYLSSNFVFDAGAYKLAPDADTVSGDATAAIATSNTLSDVIDYKVIKKWSGNTESENNRPDSISVNLKCTGYATSDAKDKTVSYVSIQLSKNSSTASWDNINGTSYEWQDLPKYDAKGYPYDYRADESPVPTNKTYNVLTDKRNYWRYVTYSTKAKTASANEELTANITNYLTEPGGRTVHQYVTKTWNDGGNESSRKPVTMSLAEYDLSQNKIDRIISENAFTFDASCGWDFDYYFNPDKDPYKLTDSSNHAYYIYESKVGGVSVNGFSCSYNATSRTISSSSTFSVNNIDYRSDAVYTISSNKTAITNTRYGVFTYTIKKIWKDGGQANDTRPDVTLTLYRKNKSGDNTGDKTVSFPDCTGDYTHKIGSGSKGTYITESGFEGSSNPVVSFNEIPRYDETGTAYEYYVKETMTDNNKEAYKAYYYTGSVGDASYDLKTRTESVNVVNTADYTGNVLFYKKWLDNDNHDKTRSDIYLNLYRSVSINGTRYLEKMNTSDWLSSRPDSPEDAENFDWQFKYYELPKFVTAKMVTNKAVISDNASDSLYGNTNATNTSYTFKSEDVGTPIRYYVSETMNIPGDYAQLYYDSVSNGSLLPASSSGLLPEDGKLVNCLSANMTIKGVKQWLNLPDGLSKNAVLNGIKDRIRFALMCKVGLSGNYVSFNSASCNTYGVKDPMTDADHDNAVYAAISADSNWNTTYAFYDTKGSLLQLPKYDKSTGETMFYKVQEYTVKNAAAYDPIFHQIYPDAYATPSDFTVVNNYKKNAVSKKIVVTKNWQDLVNTKNNSIVYPDMIFDLYMFAPGCTDIYSLNNGVPKNGTKVSTKTLKFGATSVSFNDVPVYAPNGDRYIYLVRETMCEGGYTTSGNVTGQTGSTVSFDADKKYAYIKVSDNAADSGVTFNNKYRTVSDGNYITLSGSKIWEDWGDISRPQNAAAMSASVNLTVTRTAGNITETFKQGTDFYAKWIIDNGKYYFNINEKDSHDKPLQLARYATNGRPYIYSVSDDYTSTYGVYTCTKAAAKYANTVSEGKVLDAGSITNTLGTVFYARKAWDDDNNSKAMRPSSVHFKLQYATVSDNSSAWKDISTMSGFTLSSNYNDVVLSANGAASALWAVYPFKNLPTYDGSGRKYYYRAVETQVGSISVSHNVGSDIYYGSYLVLSANGSGSTAKDPYTITNQLKSTSFTVQKTWVDSSDEYKVRPQKLTVYLKRTTSSNGETLSDNGEFVRTTAGTLVTAVLSGTGDTWSATFTGFPSVSANGDKYYYYAVENSVSGNSTLGTNTSYKLVSENYAITGTALTNKLNVSDNQYRSLSVNKSWSDADDNDGGRPESVEVELYKDGTAYTAIKAALSSGNSWAYEWKKLPIYNSDGTKARYSVKELKTSWTNSSNDTVTYNDTYTYYDAAGKSGSLSSNTVSINILNTHKPLTLSITPAKRWVESISQDSDAFKTAVRGKTVNLELQILSDNGWEKYALTGITNPVQITITGYGNADYKGSPWTNLPAYTGKRHNQYRVVETDSLPGYVSTNSAQVSGSLKAASFTATATNTLITTTASYNKTWADLNDRYGIRSTIKSINLKLQYSTDNSTWTDTGRTAEITVGNSTSNQTFGNLPVFDKDGKKFSYRVIETGLTLSDNTSVAISYPENEASSSQKAGAYQASVSAEGNVTKITNTLQQRTALTVSKCWISANDAAADGTTVSCELLCGTAANNQKALPKQTIFTLSKNNSWSVTFNDLPKNNASGNQLIYTVRELNVKQGYTPSYIYYVSGNSQDTAAVNESGITIYNTQSVKLVVSKNWIENEYDRASGQNTVSYISLKLQYKSTSNNSWADYPSNKYVQAGNIYTYSDLPLSDLKGGRYSYRAIEAGYMTKSGKYVAAAASNNSEGLSGNAGAYTYDTGDVKVDTASDNTYTETVTNTRKTKSLTVSKNWVSVDNTDRSATEVTASLYYGVKPDLTDHRAYMNNGKQASIQISANASGSFDNLPVLSADGTPFVYSVSENCDGFSTSYRYYTNGSASVNAASDNTAIGITNTQINSLTVKKAWGDTQDYGYNRLIKKIRYRLQYRINNFGSWTDWIQAPQTVECTVTDGAAEAVSFNGLYCYNPLSNERYSYRAVEDAYSLDGSTWISGNMISAATDSNISGNIGAYTYSSETPAWNAAANTQTITNTLRKRAELSINKIWHNAADVSADDSTYAEFELLCGTDASTQGDLHAKTEFTLSKNGSWAKNFTDLPAYDLSGNKLIYSVSELSAVPAGNTVTYAYYIGDTVSADNTTAITGIKVSNTQKVSLSVNKSWGDSSDYGITSRIKRIRYQLQYKNKSDNTWINANAAVNVVSVNNGQTDTAVFNGLPYFNVSANELYQYRAVETGYSLKDSGDAAADWIIVSAGTADSLSQDIGAYNYTVSAADIRDNNDGYVQTIKNTLIKIQVSAGKIWNDENDTNKHRPYAIVLSLNNADNSNAFAAPVTVSLDGNADSPSVTGYESASWNALWPSLPKYNADGSVLSYNVAEIGYISANGAAMTAITDPNSFLIDKNGIIEYSISVDNAKLQITNTAGEPRKETISAQKIWSNDVSANSSNNFNANGGALSYEWSAAARPVSVNFVLQCAKDGISNYTDVVSTDIDKDISSNTISVSSADSWKCEWTELPQYAHGHFLKYRVIERPEITGYAMSSSMDAAMLNNYITNSMNTTSYSFTKKWIDNKNVFHTRRTMTYLLQYKSDSFSRWQDGPVFTVSAADATQDSQIIKLDGLPTYDKNGKKLSYQVIEQKIGDCSVSASMAAGYTSVSSNVNGTQTFTNTLAKTSISGAKVWNDDNDFYDCRPDKYDIAISISADGVDTSYFKGVSDTALGIDVKWKTLSDNKWSFTVDGLPKYKPGTSEKITYTVSEDLSHVAQRTNATVSRNYYVASVDNTTNTVTNTFVKGSLSYNIFTLQKDLLYVNKEAENKEFEFIVSLSSANAYHGGYSGTYNVCAISDNSVINKDLSTSDGHIKLKGGEEAVISGNIPSGYKYSVSELSLSSDYTVLSINGLYSMVPYTSGTLSDNTAVRFTNRSTCYLKIENTTENPSPDAPNKKEDVGGSVGVTDDIHKFNDLFADTVSTDDHASDNREKGLAVIWEPDKYYCDNVSISIDCTELSGNTAAIHINNFIVNGVINNKWDKANHDAIYDELFKRFPNAEFKVKNNFGNGTDAQNTMIGLIFSRDAAEMPVQTVVHISFLPTLYTITTQIDTKKNAALSKNPGTAATQTSTEWIVNDDNRSTRRYYSVKSTGSANKGYYADPSRLTIAQPGHAADSDYYTIISANADGTFSQKVKISVDNVTSEITVSGRVDRYAKATDVISSLLGFVTGKEYLTYITSSTAKNIAQPAVVVVTLDKLPVPLDVGIPFIKKTSVPTSTSSTPASTVDASSSSSSSSSAGTAGNTTGNVTVPKKSIDISSLTPEEALALKNAGMLTKDQIEELEKLGILRPVTGDTAHLVFWLLLAGGAALIIVFMVIADRKRRRVRMVRK